MLNFYRLKFDYLKLNGKERLDLINRLSTNEVNSLEKFKGIKTILTSDKGRFIDLVTLYNFGDFIFAACSFNNAQNVISYLDKYTIMDDFHVLNMSGTHEAMLFYGNDSGKMATEIFNVNITELTNNDFSIFIENEHDSMIARNDDIFGGFIFIYASKDKNYWSEKLFNRANNDKYLFNEISGDQFEVTRIESGVPAFGNEMSELTNPLECGLNKYVSFTKGCYIGQEVIARLDAYDKINKHMVGIRAEKTVKLTGKTGDIKISVDNKECGFVTSFAISEKYGNIGLGFVKTLFLDYNKDYIIKNNDDLIKCKIMKLPFN